MYFVATFAEVQHLLTVKLLPLFKIFFIFLLTWSLNTELETLAVNWNNLSLC